MCKIELVQKSFKKLKNDQKRSKMIRNVKVIGKSNEGWTEEKQEPELDHLVRELKDVTPKKVRKRIVAPSTEG